MLKKSDVDIFVDGGEVILTLEKSNDSIENLHLEYVGPPVPKYSGSYSVTPSSEQQELFTAGMKLTDDIIIEAIPSNYGRISWNGSSLMVS